MATATFGVVEQFDVKGGENITEYVERLNEYFIANDIIDGRKKAAIFLTVIGQDAYSLLKNLLSPAAPNTKDYRVLTETLVNHLQPKPICIAERYKFYGAKQEAGEPLNDYIARLRSMTLYCQFGGFLEEALRDRFVCGIQSAHIRRVLLTKKDLTLEKALKVGLSLEKAEIENTVMEDKQIKEEKMFQMSSQTPKRKCYRCNDESHLANRCRFKNTVGRCLSFPV